MLLSVAFMIASISLANGQHYKSSIPLKNVGLINHFIHPDGTGRNKYSLLCSTYETSPNTIDQVAFVDRPGLCMDLDSEGCKSYVVSGSYYWSKEVQQIPDEEFGMEALLIADGSEINGKQKGKLTIANITIINETISNDISTPLIPNIKTSYRYTRAIFKQVSLLREKDILTCRGHYQSGTHRASELIHFRRPAIGSELNRPWIEHILSHDACDDNFVEVQFRYSLLTRWEALYAINTHPMEINILWPETDNGTMGRWDKPSQLNKLQLDKGKRYVDITAADLNRDGRAELVISVASEWDGNGSLEIWRVPEDFRMSKNYTKIVVDRGFIPRVTGGTSPGVVKVFHPSTNGKGKPWIFLSGHDDGRFYYYVPVNQNRNDWRYNKRVMVDAGQGQRVGGFTVIDVDGDGGVEVFVGFHTSGRIEVFTLNS